LRERDHIDRSRRRKVKLAQGKPHDLALVSHGQEARRAGTWLAGLERAQSSAERIGILGRDRRGALPAKTQAGEDRPSKRERLFEAGNVMARLCPRQ
jgi:hypothetical protein